MASLIDLLRYKKEFIVRDPRTGAEIKKIWLRILGDMDMNQAYKAARLASSAKRAALRDPETDDYKDEVLGLSALSREDLTDIIRAARLTNVANEALSSVVRPEGPTIEEVAADPDAPSLEELEKLDHLDDDIEKQYQIALDEYIKTRTLEVTALLAGMSDEEILKTAQESVSVVVPFGVFMTELGAQKALYGTFQDKDCKIREFQSTEEFFQLPKSVQEFITQSMDSLEISSSEIKN